MPSRSMPRILDAKTLRVVWTILVVGGAFALVYLLRTVLFVLAFSVVFAYLIFPLVKLVERGLPRSTRRPLAIGVVYLVLVAALSTLVALVGPPLGRELAALGQQFPEMSEPIRSGGVISNIFPRWAGAEILDDLVRAYLPQVVEYAQHGLTGALGWLSGAWVVIMIPIFAFFFLRYAEGLAESVPVAITARGGRRVLSERIAHDRLSVLGLSVRPLLLPRALPSVVRPTLPLLARL